MGLFSKLLNEFVDIIEWVNDDKDLIVWKFPRYQNEIKMGARLTVRESQVAVFMNEGKIADIYQPGMYTLSTENMPILSTLNGWKYGFNSPFKVDVYFVAMQQFTNRKWGTKNPVMISDAEFGPVRLRAFGSFAFRVSDAGVFIKEIAATQPNFTVDGVDDQLRNVVITRSMDAIASSKMGILNLAANYDDLSHTITGIIQPDFSELGLALTKFLIENISLPPEVEQILDKRSGMGIVGNLAAFTQFQAASSLEKAAENTGGGLAGAGMGLGMGAGMMGMVGNMFQQNQSTQSNTPAAVPPPIPASPRYFVAVAGKQTGPFDISELIAMANSGAFTRQSVVWTEGQAAWVPAETVPGLAQVLNKIPPPII